MQKVQETLVRSLGGEDPLEEGMATHSTILWSVVWTDHGLWHARLLCPSLLPEFAHIRVH